MELESDNDGAGDTDSKLTITLPRSGEYLIRANSLGGGETGGTRCAPRAADRSPESRRGPASVK